MANGLVGGVNGTNTTVTASSNVSSAALTSVLSTEESAPVTASITETQTYTASVRSGDAIPVEYLGVESDSMYINVDNAKRTISGEVKWRSMIATTEEQEDAYHAYPANKARINFNDISEELETLQTDVEALQTATKVSTTNLNKYIDDLVQIQTSLSNCQKFCTALKDSLDKEIATRELDHVKLRKTDAENLDTLRTEFSTLTTQTIARLDTQESDILKIKDSVSGEAFRAKYEEGRIETDLQSTTRMLYDVSKSVSALETQTRELDNIVTNIQNSGYHSVSDALVSHIEDLEGNVDKLDLRLTSQVSEASRETARLRDIIYKQSAEITNVTATVKQAKNDVEDLEQDQAILALSVDTLSRTVDTSIEDREKQYNNLSTRILDESTIRRETDNFHEEELARLELRISVLQSELVMVIQNLANELRLRDDELASDLNSVTYDFIDAGTAPI